MSIKEKLDHVISQMPKSFLNDRSKVILFITPEDHRILNANVYDGFQVCSEPMMPNSKIVATPLHSLIEFDKLDDLIQVKELDTPRISPREQHNRERFRRK